MEHFGWSYHELVATPAWLTERAVLWLNVRDEWRERRREKE